MALKDKKDSSLVKEDPGELVYLKCSCCDVLVEHHCPVKAKISGDDGAALATPTRGQREARQPKKAVSTAKKTHERLPIPKPSAGDTADGDLNGSQSPGSLGSKVHKTAADYVRQIGSDDLKVTQDGLDIYCAKCEKQLTKVAMGQRVRIDNLQSHVDSWAHKNTEDLARSVDLSA